MVRVYLNVDISGARRSNVDAWDCQMISHEHRPNYFLYRTRRASDEQNPQNSKARSSKLCSVVVALAPISIAHDLQMEAGPITRSVIHPVLHVSVDYIPFSRFLFAGERVLAVRGDEIEEGANQWCLSRVVLSLPLCSHYEDQVKHECVFTLFVCCLVHCSLRGDFPWQCSKQDRRVV